MAPRLLTKSEWRKTDVAKKPGASYGGYVKWVTKTRAARAAALANDPMAQYNAAMAGASREAKLDVKAQVDAAIAGAKAASKAAQEQATRQAERAQGFATALGKMMLPSADQVRQLYQGSADRLREYGTGLSGDVEAAQRAAAQQTAEAVARGTGGAGQVTGYDPAALRNVSQVSGVLIPGTSLEEQAANAAVAQRYGSHAAAAQVGSIADQYRQRVLDLQSTLTADITKINAQRPDLYRQALAARQQAASEMWQAGLASRQAIAQLTGIDPVTGKPTYQAQRDAAADAAAAAKAAADARAATQAQLNWERKFKQDNDQFLIDQQRKIDEYNATQTNKANEKLNIDTAKSSLLGYVVDGNGNPIKQNGKIVILPGFKRGKNGAIVKVGVGDTSTTTTTRKPLTIEQRNTLAATVKAAWLGIPNTDPKTNKKYPWIQRPMNANDVLHFLLNSYGTEHYAEIYKILLSYANRPGSRWDVIKSWQGPKMGGTRGQ